MERINLKSYRLLYVGIVISIIYLIICAPVFAETGINGQDGTSVSEICQIISVKANDGNPIEGAVFEIYDKNSVLLTTCTSDSEGKANIFGIADGTYQLKEVSTATGYSCIANQSIEIKKLIRSQRPKS